MTFAPKNGSEFPDLRLVELAQEDRELTRDEIKAVFDHVPLIVLADDFDIIQQTSLNAIKRARQDRNSVVGLRGNMEECFTAAEEFNGTKLPMILCDDGKQAKEAARIICERGISTGIVALDQAMGGPTGTNIFKELNGRMPPRITKILQSSWPPDDVEDCLKKGVLDASINKFSHLTLLDIARAYLRKLLDRKKS